MEKIPIKLPQVSVPTPEITQNISLKLFLPGGPVNGYQVHDFQIEFQQDFDFKGQPQHEVTGGFMTVVITQVPDSTINKWITKSRLLMDGSLVFKHLGHTLLTIIFEEAYCVGYHKSISSISGVATQIVISPNRISLNGFPHKNLWKQ